VGNIYVSFTYLVEKEVDKIEIETVEKFLKNKIHKTYYNVEISDYYQSLKIKELK
jgi:hypothetical protein